MPPKKKVEPVASLALEKHSEFVTLVGQFGGRVKIALALLKDSGRHLDIKDDIIMLPEGDSESLNALIEFLHEKPIPFSCPIKSNQRLDLVLESREAKFIENVLAQGDSFLLRMFNIANFLHLDELRLRLAAGLAIRLTKNTYDELKEIYSISSKEKFNEEDLRTEFKAKI